MRSHLPGTIYQSSEPPSGPPQPQEHCTPHGSQAAQAVASSACRGFPAHGARPKSHSEAPPRATERLRQGKTGASARQATLYVTRANTALSKSPKTRELPAHPIQGRAWNVPLSECSPVFYEPRQSLRPPARHCSPSVSASALISSRLAPSTVLSCVALSTTVYSRPALRGIFCFNC